VNVPSLIAMAISCNSPRVTLAELQTIYGLEDLYDVLEIFEVNHFNEGIARRNSRRQIERME